MIKIKKILLAQLVLILVCGCATHQSLLTPVRQNLLIGACEKALPSLKLLVDEKNDNQLLYLMEYGSALQICKDYKNSNHILLEADKVSEQVDYYSVSRLVNATLFNEEMLQYKGDIFEKLFINALAAINYLELEQYDEAMVEVRRINEKYSKFNKDEKKNYELNSFTQYLSGLIYEFDKKYDDACIAYKASYELDTTFSEVGLDALTACWRAKRFTDYDKLILKIKPSDDEKKYTKRKNKNEKIILFLQGLGPKKSVRPGHSVYPQLTSTPSITKNLVLNYQNENNENLELYTKNIYSVEKAAIATQEADYSALTGRRLAARVAKEVTADQIRQKDKALGDLALLVMVVSERADLRNWSLLPQTIQVARIVNPSQHSSLKVSGLNTFGAESEVFTQINFSKNKNIYLIRSIK